MNPPPPAEFAPLFELPMPQWRLDELRARVARHDAGEQALHPGSEVMADTGRDSR